MSLKDSAVLSDISKAKARGESADQMAVRAASDPSSSTSTTTVIAEVSPQARSLVGAELIKQIYGEYEATLRESNSLDFDDLLVFGLKLFTENPNILESCHHILVDEFQVNSVQLRGGQVYS